MAAGGAVDARPRRARRTDRHGRCAARRSAASRSTPTRTCRRTWRRCCERSASGDWRSSASAAACGSRCPSRRSCSTSGGWTVRYRVPLASEEYNAQISLLCGIAAAALMLQSGVGILRTQPPPDERALDAAAADGRGARGRLAGGSVLSRVRPHAGPDQAPTTPRSCTRRPVSAHGAGYTAFDGTPPAGRGALGRRRALRARDRTAAAPAGPLRLRVLSGRRDPARVGARRPRGAAGGDGRRAPGARTRSSGPSSTSSRPCCSPGARASASTRW